MLDRSVFQVKVYFAPEILLAGEDYTLTLLEWATWQKPLVSIGMNISDYIVIYNCPIFLVQGTFSYVNHTNEN